MAEYKIEERADGLVSAEDLTKKILRERAVVLARKPEEDGKSDSLHFLEFRLADEYYCLDATYIKEVYPFKDYTRIPCAPDFIFGVINFHGQILSVVDLKKVLNLSDIAIRDRNTLIILESEDMMFGIITDSVLGIRDIDEDSIQKELPSGMEMSNGHYIRGVTTDGRVILDSEALLSDPKMIVNQAI